MLGRVWLLGPHKIYPFSLPTGMAQEAVLSLAQLAETTLCPCTSLSPGSGTTRTACCSWGQKDTCTQ